MKSCISGEIIKGDLIIATTNWRSVDVGFYLGKGRGASQQYYSINTLSHWLWMLKNDPDRASKRPYKSFMANCDEYRVAKYSEALLEPEHRKMYEDSLEALKLLKI